MLPETPCTRISEYQTIVSSFAVEPPAGADSDETARTGGVALHTIVIRPQHFNGSKVSVSPSAFGTTKRALMWSM